MNSQAIHGCSGKLGQRILTTAALGLILGLGHVNAQLVYDNGPINGTIDAYTINSGYEVSDSFTVASGTALGYAQVGLWLEPGDSPVSVNWSVGTSVDGTDISSGVSDTSNTFIGSSGYGYDLYEANFLINGLVAGGPTYYFTISNAVTAEDSVAFWDINNGPSSAFQNGNPLAGEFGSTSSESFQLYGPSSNNVPDQASTFLLLGLGGLMVIVAARQMRKQSVGA
jgi:hypothetical protein